MSDSTLPWPHALRERLADDGDRLVIFVIEVVEVASLKYRNAKRREKAGRDSAPHRAGVFVGVRVTVSGVLKTGAEILSIAPGRHKTEGCARNTRKRIDLTDRFFIEIENLLGRFAVRHRRNVNGEDVLHVETGLGGLQGEKSSNQSTRAGEKHERGGDLSNGQRRCCRRLVLPVIRTLPLATFKPLALSAEGRRRTRARITAATRAKLAPAQRRLESTVRSKARTEKREAYRARTETRGWALSTPIAAPAPQRRRLSANSMRRSAAVLAPRAARTASSPSRRTVRARIRLTLTCAAGDDEDQT